MEVMIKLIAEVEEHGKELCNQYDNLALDPNRKFSVELGTLIFKSVVEGTKKVLSLASSIINIVKVEELINKIETTFDEEAQTFTEITTEEITEKGYKLRKAVQKTVILVFVKYIHKHLMVFCFFL